ncbi:hypothetical protein P7K49_027921 [Saguinus oedipus]|uniref:ADP-ribosylation factor-like protein 2-binding protein n=1 Tax=Saguinus oedipus TaxID=9490 RepID=A0ABQ9UAS7_SAGOE|nr:hypothetical protein P7K49_027921 [Saguinus oedipus]
MLVGKVAATDALEEKSFLLPLSSASDAEFEAVVRYLEDTIMDEEFHHGQVYQEFEDTEVSLTRQLSQQHGSIMKMKAGDLLDVPLTFVDFLAFEYMFLD